MLNGVNNKSTQSFISNYFGKLFTARLLLFWNARAKHVLQTLHDEVFDMPNDRWRQLHCWIAYACLPIGGALDSLGGSTSTQIWLKLKLQDELKQAYKYDYTYVTNIIKADVTNWTKKFKLIFCRLWQFLCDENMMR